MKETKIISKRNTNMEILRIIAIIFIVISHYSVHNVIDIDILPTSINKILLQMITLGNMGSELFMLITGYYLVNSKKVKLSKVLKLWLQIIFYSVGIYILFVILKLEPFSIKTFIKSFLPITFSEYWYASVYFIIYLFHPYINIVIDNLKQKEYLKLILLCIIIFSVLNFVTNQLYYFNELIQLIIIYIIGAYYGKYKNNYLDKKRSKRIFIICLLILIGLTIGLEFINNNTSRQLIINLYSRNSLLIILISVSLFNIFKTKKEYSNNIINKIADCTFGIYLLSETPLMRTYLWKNIFSNLDYIYSPKLIIHMLVSVSLTIIVCIKVELLRKETLDRIYNKYISKKVDDVSKKSNIFFDRTFSNFIK